MRRFKNNSPAPAIFEPVEGRTLFSIVATVGAGTLFIYGDDQPNGINVDSDGTNIIVEQYQAGKGYTEFYRVKSNKVNTLRMYGRGGPDTLTVDSVGAVVYISGEAGADYIHGAGYGSFLYGHSANPTDDDNAADTLRADGLFDVQMHGNGGDDHFFFERDPSWGTAGHDLAVGGKGNDTFHAARDERRSHKLYGGLGSDTIDFSSFPVAVHVELSGANYSGIRQEANTIYKRNYDLHGDIENAVGSKFGDYIAATPGNVLTSSLLVGNDGSDIIFGSWGNDVVRGGKGNDRIFGLQGNDKLYGEAGNDTIRGGAGVDWLVGGAGNDALYANDGDFNDLIFGGETNGADGGTDTAFIDHPVGVWKDFVFAIDSVIKM